MKTQEEKDYSFQEAWKLLQDKGLSFGEMNKVKFAFADMFREEYPFVKCSYKTGKIEFYHSEIEEIKSFAFLEEKEVILANALYENMKDNFDQNNFRNVLKFTFRIMGISNEWTK